MKLDKYKDIPECCELCSYILYKSKRWPCAVCKWAVTIQKPTHFKQNKALDKVK